MAKRQNRRREELLSARAQGSSKAEGRDYTFDDAASAISKMLPKGLERDIVQMILNVRAALAGVENSSEEIHQAYLTALSAVAEFFWKLERNGPPDERIMSNAFWDLVIWLYDASRGVSHPALAVKKINNRRPASFPTWMGRAYLLAGIDCLMAGGGRKAEALRVLERSHSDLCASLLQSRQTLSNGIKGWRRQINEKKAPPAICSLYEKLTSETPAESARNNKGHQRHAADLFANAGKHAALW